MNLKKAKALRRLSRDVVLNNENLFEDTIHLQHKQRGNIVVHPQSMRGVYLRLKKEVR